MICPLREIGNKDKPCYLCLIQDCAWYSKKEGKCAILLLAEKRLNVSVAR